MALDKYIIREDGRAQAYNADFGEFLNLKTILEEEYKYILDSIENENHHLEYTGGELFKEVLYENMVVGFAYYQFYHENIILNEFYVLDEFRDKNLYVNELISMCESGYPPVIMDPTDYDIKLLLENGYAVELENGIAASGFEFSFLDRHALTTLDFYVCDKIYYTHFYDFNISSAIYIDESENDNIVYHEPSKDYVPPVGDDYFDGLIEYANSNKDFFSEVIDDLEADLPKDATYRIVVGEDEGLSDYFRALIDKKVFDYETALKVKEILKADYENGFIDDETVIVRLILITKDEKYEKLDAPLEFNFASLNDLAKLADSPVTEAIGGSDMFGDLDLSEFDFYDPHSDSDFLADIDEDDLDLLADLDDSDFDLKDSDLDSSDLSIDLDDDLEDFNIQDILNLDSAELMIGSHPDSLSKEDMESQEIFLQILKNIKDDEELSKQFVEALINEDFNSFTNVFLDAVNDSDMNSDVLSINEYKKHRLSEDAGPITYDLDIFRYLSALIDEYEDIGEDFFLECGMSFEYFTQFLEDGGYISVKEEDWKDIAREHTVVELKDILRENNLPVSGRKMELVERLEENLPAPKAIRLSPKGANFLSENSWIMFYDEFIDDFDFNEFSNYLKAHKDKNLIDVSLSYLEEHRKAAIEQDDKDYLLDCDIAIDLIREDGEELLDYLELN